MTRHILMTVATLCLVSMSATAQHPDDSPHESPVSLSDPSSPAAFGRYQHPEECARDAAWSERAFWRSRRPDTAAMPRSGAPEQPTTVAAVRACLARFTVESVPQADLLGLGEASLAANQPDAARRAFDRLTRALAEAPLADRSWALYQIASIYLEAQQPDLDAASQQITRLDAMGAGAAVERMLAHTLFAQVARVRDSVALQGREGTAALTASREITGDTRREWANQSAEAYSVMALYHFRRSDTAAGRNVLRDGIKTLLPLRPRAALILQNQLRWSAILEQPAARIQADRWYPASAATPVRPVPGTPSLIAFVSFRDPRAFEGYGVLRRLIAAYAARGVTMTFVARTQGFVGTALTSPDSEAARIKAYYLDDLNLPVTLALSLSEFGRRSDGRRTLDHQPNEQAYRSSGRALVQTYLVDAQGKIRWVDELTHGSEATFNDMLGELLRASP